MQLQQIETKIYEIRGQKVMLDFDLAEMYEVETRVLNQSVKRNIESFPADFMLQLSQKEWESMLSQIVMTNPAKHPKTLLALAFIKVGVTMLARFLKGKKVKQTSISIIRAFVFKRQ